MLRGSSRQLPIIRLPTRSTDTEREVEMADKHPEWMGKNRKLTPAEVKEFLAEPVVARIATIDENGVPYVTPVWQEWDGEAFWIVPPHPAPSIPHIHHTPNSALS